LEYVVEQVSYVIIDQSSMVISAFSTSGKQVNITYNTQVEFLQGMVKCTAWLPTERILSKH